jgi:hypothetical protein
MEDNKKIIRELVKLYFDYNPQNNRGVAWKAKTHDIISSYINIHNKSYDEIKACIEAYPMTKIPIWNQFDYFFNIKKKIEKPKQQQKSNYKNSISDSTDVNDWM